MIADYDILRDDHSEYYESAERSAFYYWQPGRTLIELKDFNTGERVTGYIQQGEKADGICRQWIETGTIPRYTLNEN